MKKFQSILLGLLLLGTVVSCKQNDIGLSDNDIFQADEATILNYAATKGLSGSSTPSGVYYALQKPGSSTVSTANGMEVEYNYTLYKLSSGTSTTAVTDVFVDSTYATKSNYINVVATNLGLMEGLLQMHEGDQAVILLPSFYAFGRSGTSNGVIPPNTPVRLNLTMKRTRTETQQIDEYMTANKLTPTQVTTSGLRFIKTLDNPSGVLPLSNQTLVVRYKGKLLRSASAFDSTGTSTRAFTLGNTIPGFSEGLAKLKTGEKATIILPSAIGYSSLGAKDDKGDQIIPAYAPLRFDIELVSVQ